MTHESRIRKIFSSPDLKHGLSLFTDQEINAVENLIVERDEAFQIKCQVKDRFKPAKPEEIVRQLWIHRLLTEYNYTKERLDVEKEIYFGSRIEPGAADIVVYRQGSEDHYILFEVKRPSRAAGLEQLKSYCNAEGAPIGVWSNGNEIIRLHREEPNTFIEIPRIPRVSETLRDILTERWTLKWLEDHDELKQGKTTLKKILLDLEELVLGNASVKVFDEIFKLIYAKLYDEWKGINDAGYQLEFYVGDRSPDQVKTAITGLLDGAIRTWSGVFEQTEEIRLMDRHLTVCVSFLEKVKLFNSNLQIIDEAFEYLIPEVAKKKEGQFFTPRPVVDMIVKMLNPKTTEYVIDPACGSAGFLLHSVIWVAGGAITGKELSTPAKNFAQNNIYGIDFAKEAVKIAKAINLIVGDGRAHVYGGGPHGNSLDPLVWDDEVKAGLRARLATFREDLVRNRDNQNRFLYFDFDVLMTNPPFAGTVKEREILRLYELAEKNGKLVAKIGRHILFLNRSLQFIRPAGRMAIVLPQGLLNNTNAEYIRRFVMDEARILAVVSLHVNTFKPHTGTKTSVLFLQKLTDQEKQRILDVRARYSGEWKDYLSKLCEQYRAVKWDTPIDERELSEEFASFMDTYLAPSQEEVDVPRDENVESSQGNQTPEGSLSALVEDMKAVQDELDAVEGETQTAPNAEKAREKATRLLRAKIEKLVLKISEKTLGGHVFLTLHDEAVRAEFEKYWLDRKVTKEIDYPIFFAVNQNPLKDESGDYRYKKAGGEVILDEHEHPAIDHDLDEIADAFVRFAKEQGFDFWRV